MAGKKEKTKKKTLNVEKKEPMDAPVPSKKITLKEKISRTVNDWKDDPEELKKQIFGLVQRTLYPDQFCPECDDRLFLKEQVYNCANCGYQRNLSIQAPTTSSIPTTPAVNVPPGQRPSTVAPVPKEVEAMINKSKEDMKGNPRRGGVTKMGAKIQQLVADRDSGGAQTITPQDEAAVKRDSNVSNKINWV